MTTGKSVEEMARELGNSIKCPPKTIGQRVRMCGNIPPTCHICWRINATPAEIRAKYAELKGEGE
jgi:hypothetical protein